MTTATLERRALQLSQHPDHPLYLFALRPKEILRIASISRVGRGENLELIGYQRKEVQQHVREIQAYLDKGAVLFPNAIILAFDDRVRFRKSRGPGIDDGLAASGTLEIPEPEEGGIKPAWIIDGQQRALALDRSKNNDLPIPVAAIAGAGIKVQREQFLLINNTKPLPTGLVTELLPAVETYLSRKTAARRLPSALCDVLNRAPESPFFGLIKRPSDATEEGKTAILKDTQVVEMIRQRLQDVSGCLFPYRNIATGETDTAMVQRLLFDYWRAVRDTFSEAWSLAPARSRLMHGAGIEAMGHLMDAVLARVNPMRDDIYQRCKTELARIAPLCRWTAGSWEELNNLPWNAIENTNRSKRLLTNHLVRAYTLALHRR